MDLGLDAPPPKPLKDAVQFGTSTARVADYGDFTLSRIPATGPLGYIDTYFSAQLDSGFKITASQRLDSKPDETDNFSQVTTSYRIELPRESVGQTPQKKGTIVTFQILQSEESSGGTNVSSAMDNKLLSDEPLPYGCVISEQDYFGETTYGTKRIIANYGDVTQPDQIDSAASVMNRVQLMLINEYEKVQDARVVGQPVK